MTMRDALKKSVNNATVTYRDLGVRYVIDCARRFGIEPRSLPISPSPWARAA